MKPEKMKIKNNQDTQEYFFEEGCYITELWNENSDTAVSIARARLGPGETTKKHVLNATTERYLILEGEGRVFIGPQDEHTVKKNDVVVIPAATSQYIQNTGEYHLVFLAICTPRFLQTNYRALE